MAELVTKYQQYAEYKDSEVEWLGKIPKDWEISKLRYMFSFGRGLTITKADLLDTGVPCVSYGEVHSKYGFEVDPKKHYLKCVNEGYLQSSPYALLTKGDLVFADTSEDIEGSGNFTQLVSDDLVFAGYHTVIARPFDRQCSRFYAYLMDSKEIRTQIRHMVKGVKVFSITQAILKGVEIWLPSLDERETIANFLDYETAQIDTLIEKQQTLITLLKEKRQAVISHAVTKGLNPDAPMKDSGVEWLGEVPEHWEVSKLKYYSSIQGGYAFSSDSFIEEGVQILKIGNVYQNRLALERQPTFVPEAMLEALPDFIVKDGDILMSLTGTLGKRDYGFAVAIKDDGKYLLNQRVAKLNPADEKIDRDFLINVLWSESYLNQLYSLPSGTKQANLSNSDVLDIVITLPPSKTEQKEIAVELQNQKDIFDKAIQKAMTSIELMQERRIALISAAVTGKIDVRGWVAPE